MAATPPCFGSELEIRSLGGNAYHAVQLAPTRSSDGICGWMGGKVIREFVRGMIYDKPEANIHTGERIVQQIRAKNFPFCFREHVVETLTTE